MTAPHSQTTTPNPLGALLRRGWLWLVLSVLVGVAAGYLLTFVLPKKYQATASVLVTATGVNNSQLANARTTGTINLDTEAQLAKSTAVAQQVQQMDPARRAQSIPALTSGLSLTVPPNTEVLDFTYTAPTADVAEATANDFASAYLDVRQANAQAQLKAQIDKVSTSVNSLNAQLKSVSDQLASLPDNSNQRDYAQAQRSLLVSQITSLNTQLNQLTSTAVSSGQLLSQATVPSKPSSPSLAVNLGAGLACGLLLGLLLAWLSFARIRRLTRPDDVVRILGMPVAGLIETVQDGTVEPTGSVAFQDYRRVLGIIAASIGSDGIVMVTGATDDAPTQTVAANLATVVLHSGNSVAVLSHSSDPAIASLREGARVFDSDSDIRIGREVVARERLDRIRDGDLLLVTADAPAASADSVTLAHAVDAVLLVLPVRTSVAVARAAVRELDGVGAPILGAVLVPAVARAPVGSSAGSLRSRLSRLLHFRRRRPTVPDFIPNGRVATAHAVNRSPINESRDRTRPTEPDTVAADHEDGSGESSVGVPSLSRLKKPPLYSVRRPPASTRSRP